MFYARYDIQYGTALQLSHLTCQIFMLLSFSPESLVTKTGRQLDSSNNIENGVSIFIRWLAVAVAH